MFQASRDVLGTPQTKSVPAPGMTLKSEEGGACLPALSPGPATERPLAEKIVPWGSGL